MRSPTLLVALLALFVLGGCMSNYYAPPPRYAQGHQYTRVSMKVYRGNTIAYTNFLLQPGLIPAGTPIRVLGVSPRAILLDVNGMRHYFVPGQGRPWNLAFVPAILDKYLGPTPPLLPHDYNRYAVGIQTFPGGLKKEDVLTIFGYPASVGAGTSTENLSRAQILASENWVYYLNAWRVRTRIQFQNGLSVPARLGR